jgi:hypothetical protein
MEESMERSTKTSLTFGIILILLGALFLVFQLFPQLGQWIKWSTGWPLIIVGVGLVFLVSAVLSGASGLAIPGSIIGGVGGLMWWQNMTGNWNSWAYAWALIPGFVGVGIILNGLLSGRVRDALTGGGWLIMISLIMFFIFGSFLGGMELFGAYWPVLLIILGVFVLVRPLLRIRGQ